MIPVAHKTLKEELASIDVSYQLRINVYKVIKELNDFMDWLLG